MPVKYSIWDPQDKDWTCKLWRCSRYFKRGWCDRIRVKSNQWIKGKKTFQDSSSESLDGAPTVQRDPTPLGHHHFGSVPFEGKDKAFAVTSHCGAED